MRYWIGLAFGFMSTGLVKVLMRWVAWKLKMNLTSEPRPCEVWKNEHTQTLQTTWSRIHRREKVKIKSAWNSTWNSYGRRNDAWSGIVPCMWTMTQNGVEPNRDTTWPLEHSQELKSRARNWRTQDQSGHFAIFLVRIFDSGYPYKLSPPNNICQESFYGSMGQ